MGHENKLLLKHGVLTKGNGDRRAVLDFEVGIIYAYHDASNILGEFVKGLGWVIRKTPHYYASGWGNASTGDSMGHHLIENALGLVRAVGGRAFQTNTEQFLTQKETRKLNRIIAKHNRNAKRQNKAADALGCIGVKVDTTERIKPLKIEPTRHHDHETGTVKGLDPIETARKYQTAVKVFTERAGRKVKVDSYCIDRDLITQQNKDANGQGIATRVVAFRDSTGQVFMNSEVIALTSFERTFMGSQSLIQAEVRKVAKFSIPFNVLAAADLKLSETRVLEQGPESTHTVKRGPYDRQTEERHFTGALLLENAGRKFLMDIDRREIEHDIFNAFFVEVDARCTSIAECYESMKPQSVKDAEAQGLEVKRQGEWFFIETDKTITVPKDDVLDWDREQERTRVILRHEIKHGKGRPNTVYKPVGFEGLDGYVCGTVEHSGREHATLDLGSTIQTTTSPEGTKTEFKTFRLWTLAGNTTVSNFTITGDID
jgi:hypothetical protein